MKLLTLQSYVYQGRKPSTRLASLPLESWSLARASFVSWQEKNVRKIWSTEASGPSGSNPEFVLPQLRPRHADHSRVSPVLECERPWRGYPMTTALLSLATKSFMMLHGTFEQVSTRLMCSRMARLSASFCAGAVSKAKKSHAFAACCSWSCWPCWPFVYGILNNIRFGRTQRPRPAGEWSGSQGWPKQCKLCESLYTVIINK